MTPDRLDQISRIFHEALSRSEGERSAFLSEACGADQSLRQEIESLRALFGPDVRLRPDYTTRQFDVTPDGQRFLMILRSPDDDAPTQMTVVYNWQR